MGLEPLCVLAIAGSAVSLVCSLVVMLRSTPQRVRKAAYAAAEIAEEAQAVVRAAANRMITFQDEITREREAAAGDLQEAERKRRQAAAKLSAVDKKEPDRIARTDHPGRSAGPLSSRRSAPAENPSWR